MILLDTDTLSLLMHGHGRVTQRVNDSDAIGITVVSWIEILRGRFDSVLKAANGAEVLKAQHWLSENERYLSAIDLARFDAGAAAEFDKL